MVELTRVTKSYGPLVAVDDVSLTVRRGEMVVIHGPSGAGKTTLLKMMMMEELPTTGSVVVAGFRSAKMSARKLSALRRCIGVIYQDFRLLRDRSVFDNVALPLLVAGHFSRDELRFRVHAGLAAVGLGERHEARPDRLSGGEQQRVALARALVGKPDLVLADEPTGNLDAASTTAILDLLAELPPRGTAVVLASHDQGVAERLGVRAIEMSAGRIVAAEPAPPLAAVDSQ